VSAGEAITVKIFKSGQELKITFPENGKITMPNYGEKLSFGGPKGNPDDPTHTFSTPFTATTPVPALSMTYDSTQIQSGGTIDFGEVSYTARGSKTYTITFTNTGDEGTKLDIKNITLTGDTAFEINSTDDLSIQKGASSTKTITFTPSAEQTYNATLTFKANTGTAGADVDVTINLTGKGITEPVAIFSPSVTTNELDFGIVKVGSSSEKTVTITNAGGYNLVLSQGTVEGADKDQFSLSSDTCSKKTIEPNGSCSITIKFSPTSTGAKTAVAKILRRHFSTGRLEFWRGTGWFRKNA
jgi:hypothetical protein